MQKNDDVKEHNNLIIEDNIAFGLLHPDDYTKREINEYEQQARSENKSFLAFLRGYPGARIIMDQTTEMFKAVPYIASEGK